MVELRPARAEDILDVAPRMRQADVDEVYAVSGRDPHDALVRCLALSDWAWTATIAGRPEVMFGVATASLLPHVGTPWLLGTDEVVRHAKRLLPKSREVVDLMLARYPILRNAVDDRNEASKRWLRWLGFEMGPPMITGFEQRPFRFFEKRASHV